MKIFGIGTDIVNIKRMSKTLKSKNNNLKTGYICDIDRYVVSYLNNSEENIIVKVSNLDNELS